MYKLAPILAAASLALACTTNSDCAETMAQPASSPEASTSAKTESGGSTVPASLTHKQLQKKLAEVMVTPASHQQIIQQASSAMTQALANSGQPQPDDLPDKLNAIIAEALPYQDVLAISAKVYGEQFTRDELAELVRFYGTNTGQKLLKQQPQLTQNVSTHVSSLVSQRWPAAARRHGLTP